MLVNSPREQAARLRCRAKYDLAYPFRFVEAEAGVFDGVAVVYDECHVFLYGCRDWGGCCRGRACPFPELLDAVCVVQGLCEMGACCRFGAVVFYPVIHVDGGFGLWDPGARFRGPMKS